METTLKICTMCKKEKHITSFHKSKQNKNGISAFCKDCAYNKTTLYNRTKMGLIKRIYKTQKANSKKRNHNPPEYDIYFLIDLLQHDSKFNTLYENWVNSSYNKMLSPSIDRIDDNIGYTKENIQLMTWEENASKNKFNRTIEVEVEITKRYKEGNITYVELGKHYNTSRETIRRIIKKNRNYLQ